MIRVPSYVGWPLVAASSYGVLYFLANRAAYYPLKYPQGLWEAQSQLGASDVWLRTADGVRLHAWWVPRPDARLVTLYFHGNAGNVTHRLIQMREIPAAGSAILMPDYRGYGKSEGRPGEKGLYADGDAAYGHLLDMGYRAEQIVLHGESLGTAVAVDLAARHACAALVLESSFTSGRDVARTVLPILGPLLFWSFDSADKIHKLHAPLLVMHGEHDEVIPLKLGRALYQAAPEPKSFWEIPGAGHNDLLDVAGARYRERLAAFYQSLR